MDEKIEILQCLIDNHIFAPSTSALAKILGYKGKMTLYRLMQGTVSEKLVNGIWNKLLSVYSLEDTTLYALARICYMTKVFNDHIQTEMNTKHPEWVEEAHKVGLKVNVWTVNETPDLQKMLDLKVDFITTDHPVEAKELASK